MTEVQVGREMDAAVARVLGCTPVRRDGKWDWQCQCDGGAHITKHVQDEQGDWYELAGYSTDDCDSLAALDAELVQRPGWGYEISSTNGKRHNCMIFDNTQQCRADCGLDRSTRAEAICRCILILHKRETE